MRIAVGVVKEKGGRRGDEMLRGALEKERVITCKRVSLTSFEKCSTGAPILPPK
jgi:hypothetical protein